MDITITLDGTDITTKVVTYDRDKALCTGIGQLRLEVEPSVSAEIYQEVVVTEEGNKKGTYFIHSIDISRPKGTKLISAQDASLKAQTYFIAESYFIDYPSSSVEWITKFLTDATISYSLNVSGGSLLSNNTTLGMCFAMDAIIPLLQQNGWFMTFDANNVAQIGRITSDPTSFKYTLSGDKVLSVETTNHDKMFRNRILVWGAGDPTTARWIYTDLDRSGNYPNEYDANDKRTVVIANSNIKEKASANAIAARALKEFEKLNYEITVDYAGELDVDIGDFIHISTDEFEGGGMVTNVGSSLSGTSGLVTHIVLNQRCPRIFAYYDFGGYVYVGTEGNGVWRKPLKDSMTWSNFSTGLSDLTIIDLAIKNGTYATVSDQGHLFTRGPLDASWKPFTPNLIDDEGNQYPAQSGMATACTIDKGASDYIIASFSLRNEVNPKSWIYYISPNGTKSTRYPLVDENDNAHYTVIDLDNNGVSNVVSALMSYSGEFVMWDADSREANPNYYLYPNTLSGIVTGFSGYIYDIYNSYPGGYFIPVENKTLYGDGNYIYFGESYLTSQAPYDGWSAAYKEYHALSGIIDSEATAAISDPRKDTYTFISKPVGNREFGFIYYDDVTTTNMYYKWDIENSTTSSRDMYTRESFFSMNVLPAPSGIRSFAMSADETSTQYLAMWAINNTTLNAVKIAEISPVLTALDGTFDAFSFPIIASVVGDDYIIAYLQSHYSGCTVDGYPGQNVTIPTLVFFNINSWQMSIYVLENLINASTMNPTMYAFGVLHNNAYLVMEQTIDYTSYYNVYRIEPTGSMTQMLTSDYSTYNSFIASKDQILIPYYDGYGWVVKDVVGGSTKATIDKPATNVCFCRQISSEGHILVYDKDTGNINTYSVVDNSPLAETTIETNIFPEETDGFVYDYTESHIGLIFDKLAVQLSSFKYINFNYGYGEKIVRGLFVPVSGMGGPPADHTIYISNKPYLLKGSRANKYDIVREPVNPYKVEISQQNPVTIYTTTSYSGIVVSGIQTGFSAGQIYVSPLGGINTYTPVLLNSLKSSVPDLRVASMMKTYSGETDTSYCKVLVVPLPGDIGTELLTVDLMGLNTGQGVIYTSGIFDTGATSIIATFDETINHVETTNTPENPYMFVSSSGLPPVFYQKDGYFTGDELVDTIFMDHTSNLPADHAITIIRCDDEI